MDELLLNFLGREREKTVRIGERTCAMRLLSARETLSLRREIARCYALLDGAENPSSEDGREKVEALKKAWSTRPTNG